MSTFVRRALLAPCAYLVAIVSSACGGSSTTGSAAAASSADLRAMCSADCDWASRCRVDAPPVGDAGTSCVDGCLEKLGPLSTSIRVDAARALQRCYEQLRCGGSDDGCTLTAIAATGGTFDAAIHAGDVEACLAKHEECKASSPDFGDDICGTLAFLVDSKRAELARCFDEPCASAAACLGR
ncbi:MAG TPA: hypothetical protein VHU80_14675 [Polyangiaceae bacterium]|jgi:hypothetical protein|nr:hypothetical protein [Polyangiaceae bacterium]